MTLSVIPEKGSPYLDTDVEHFEGGWLGSFFVSGFSPSLVSNVVQVTTGVAILEGHWVKEAASTFNIPFVASGAHVWLQLTRDGSGYVNGIQYLSQSATPADSIKICDYTDNGTQVTSVTDQTQNELPVTTKKKGASSIGVYPLGIESIIPLIGPLPAKEQTPSSTPFWYIDVGQGSSTTPLYLPYAQGSALTEVGSNITIDVLSIRKTIEFSKIFNLSHAYFEIIVAGQAADAVSVDLYDVTAAATIASSALSVTLASATAMSRAISGDIKGNLPTADHVLTVRAFDTTTNANNVYISSAALKLFW